MVSTSPQVEGIPGLVAFLNARLDEDEAAARAATAGPWWAVQDRHDDDRKIRLVKAEDPALPGDDPTYATRAEHIALSVTSDPDDDEQANLCHIARHDPARALREVEAGRAILALHEIGSEPEIEVTEHHDKKWNTGWVERQETGRTSYWCAICDNDRDYGHIGGPWEGCETLRHLAAIWCNHPDYRQEWAP